MNKLKAVLFDLDETLFDRTKAMDYCARTMAINLVSGEKRDEFLKKFIELDNGGYSGKTKNKFASEMIEAFGLQNISPEEFVAQRDDVSLGGSELFPHAMEVVKFLKDKKLKLGIITNAGRHHFQYKKIEHVGLVPLMDSIIISDSFGAKKPDPSIFQAALTEIECRAENVLFVGDNPIADIKGAKSLGMMTAYKTNKKFGDVCEESDFVFSDFIQFKDKLIEILRMR